MAQNARVAALTDELVQSIVGFDPEADRRAYKHARDIAAKGLRGHQYNRTNQFEIRKSFEGLDEKFRVLNRDDLADALQTRLQELQGRRNKWIPEYLALLLQLSDRPTEDSKVETLGLLRPPTPPPPLTWAEILEDDPYSDEEIWKDIDYAAESSEDERMSRRERKGKLSPPSSVDQDDMFDPESCVIPVDTQIISEIEEVQFWKAQGDEETGKVEITELQATRETLFMLAGLRTSLYLTDKQYGHIRVNQKYVFGHAIAKTMDHLLSQLAVIGRHLLLLRQWTRRPSSLPLIQTFESAVKTRLADYDKSLAFLQRQYLVPSAPIAVSLLELHSRVREISEPMLQLSRLVVDIEPELLVNPFVHLETLFQGITLAQMTLEKDIFHFLSSLFFECLQTYLKPIRKWMQSGELGANDETFFVFENDAGSETSSLWHDRFVLRRGKGDALRSPAFLEPAAMKIFNTGKSVVFLKELGIYSSMLASAGAEPHLDHQTVCGTSELPLSPFPELFQSAFETWIKSKYSLASTVLRSHLFSQCGLLVILNNFHILYLGADGSAFQDFADAIFERMDSKRRGWNDRFLLTELARGIYATVLGKPSTEKIVVRSVRMKDQTRSIKGLATVALDYALPWPIQNIIQRSSLPIYQTVFTTLLQTYRAKYLLQRIRLSTVDLALAKTPKLKQLTFKIRNQLIWFVDILRSYFTETVIARSNAEMRKEMEGALDIDEMAGIHIKFLARMQEQALLSENLRPVHRAVKSLLDLAVLFHDSHMRSAQGHRTAAKGPNGGARTGPDSKFPTKRNSRKSAAFSAALVDDESSGLSDSSGTSEPGSVPRTASEGSGSLEEDLHDVDAEFRRLLPFLTAALRNIGRVGAEGAWEGLAERLEGGSGWRARGGDRLSGYGEWL